LLGSSLSKKSIVFSGYVQAFVANIIDTWIFTVASNHFRVKVTFFQKFLDEVVRVTVVITPNNFSYFVVANLNATVAVTVLDDMLTKLNQLFLLVTLAVSILHLKSLLLFYTVAVKPIFL